VPCDVVAEGVAHHMRVNVRVDAGARRELHHPGGTSVGSLGVGITASFDIVLPRPMGHRRLIDGATGFDPATTISGRTHARTISISGSRVEVPIDRTFDWEELTGRPWWRMRPSATAPPPPPAEILFFTSDLPPHRKQQR
jgi:hypothetical protein